MFLVVIIIILLVCYGLTYLKNKKSSGMLTEKIIKEYENKLKEFDEEMLNNIKLKLEKLFYPDHITMPVEILNKKDFNKSFSEATFLAHLMDKKRDVSNVKLMARFIVKYYAPYILKYGDISNKARYCKNIEILKKYKEI